MLIFGRNLNFVGERLWHNEYMLSFSDITIQYTTQSQPLLSNVSFDVEQGKHVVLLGSNGSGKSSLMLCALGFLAPSDGGVFADGFSMGDAHQAHQARRFLGYVGQNPDDGIVATHVTDEVAFGPENLGLPREEIARRVDEALAKVGLSDYKNREPHTLSGGQKQRLVIAGALAMHPRYLLLDEPCSMLDPAARGDILALIEQARAEGLGILHITHDIFEAKNADEIIVLCGGAVAFRGTHSELLQHESDFDEWGIELKAPFVERDGIALSETQYDLEGVGVTYLEGNQQISALREASIVIHKNEFIVIEGQTGAGKSTLLKALAGLLDVTTGAITFEDQPFSTKRARGAVGLVFQNPEMSLFGETVLEDVAFGPRNFGASEAEALQAARKSLSEVGLDPVTFGQRTPLKLSGGEARKVALAGVLAFSPRVILADEPTAALDASGRLAVRRLLAQCSRAATVIVVTHSPEEFVSMADRVFHLEDGSISEVEKGSWKRASLRGESN